ncbi:TOTE conflict system archaeo-eukaryotic primase domain-containing protein [Prescottella equi]
MSPGCLDGSAYPCADPSTTQHKTVTTVTHDAWRHIYYQAFREVGPRETARVDLANTHVYTDVPLPPQLPEAPIATYLADDRGTYKLLAFDFDAPRTDRREPGLVASIADAVAFSSVLRALGIPHLVTASGSTWGRHVWIRLNEGVAARTVRRLAKLVKDLHPTLDLSPLANPRTGCVRIPGSVHRRGGLSEPIAVDDDARLEQLAAFSAGAHSADLRRLQTHLRSQLAMLNTAGTATAPRAERPAVSPYETLAGPVIVGTRAGVVGLRPGKSGNRSRALVAALTVPIDRRDDHSRAAFSLLTRMAVSGWTRSDVLTAAATAPGLEYLRTARCGTSTRVDRPDPTAFTIRQWGRANAKVAGWATSRSRSASVYSAGVRRASAIQKAADASPTEWSGQAGVHRRCVLDALCLLACETGAVELDIDQRRLALSAGVTQPTASRTLKWLRDNSWVSRTATGRATEADRYLLTNPQGRIVDESQGVPTPELHTTLHHRLLHARHDLWTRDGLGSLSGALHRAILSGHHSLSSLAQATGLTVTTIRDHRDRLINHGLLTRSGKAVRRLAGAMLTAATEMGVTGVVEARRRLYTAQSLVWEWWNRELAWRTAPASAKPLRSDHPMALLRRPFPTGSDGQADFSAALGRMLTSLRATSSATAA